MSKYEPLGMFLRGQRHERVPMTFAEIERIVRAELPPSKRHRAWWSNNPNNNVMTRQWLEAGYETESVDLASEKLVFRRMAGTDSTASGHLPKESGGSGGLPPIFGCMKGLITLADGYDPAAPTGEDWEDGYLGEPDSE